MYLGIDVHKRESQVAVRNEDGEVVREVRVENASKSTLEAKPQSKQPATITQSTIHSTSI